MSIPDGVLRYTLSGALSTTETFNTSWWMTGYTLGTAPDDSTLGAGVLAAPWTTWFNSLKTLMGNSDSITGLDSYFYQGGVAVRHGHASMAIVGGSALQHPKQSCCVMTLRTALATRSGRGRMYLPATGAPMAGTGLMTSATIDAVVDATGAMFSAITDATIKVVVLSQKTGITTPVVAVDADYVPDTQRRRRNKLVSSRHTSPVS